MKEEQAQPISGTFRLFRVAGIDVRLHWSWFAVAVLQILLRPDVYRVPAWKVAEYLTLFAVVLAHEFGHAFACRSVGGKAERVVLWPLGGIAYVAPPPRPGAVLWSIAAGPLVNLVLMPLLAALFWHARDADWPTALPDQYVFVRTITLINFGLLLVNLLPVYPLDGGQILHALLWFVLGRWRSLLAVSVIGFAGAALAFGGSVAAALAFGPGALFGCLVAAFIGLRSFLAFHSARSMLRLEKLPRHEHCACPNCGEAPPRGEFWQCGHCGTKFDTFETRGRCGGCGAWYLETACPRCGVSRHVDSWYRPEL
jgi:Zn-dependent protease